jgi:prevent-host-death family protein
MVITSSSSPVIHRSRIAPDDPFGRCVRSRERTDTWFVARLGGVAHRCATLTHMSESGTSRTSSVGIRALQQHASAVVARVAAGERIVVTDRGRPAALLIPLPGAGLERLVAAGLARPARRPAAEIHPPAPARPADRPLSEALAELRADERD